MKSTIYLTLPIFILTILLTNISCEKLEIKRVIKIKTEQASNITPFSADLNGTFIDIGNSGVSEWGFYYSKGADDKVEQITPTSVPKKGSFSASVNNLEPNTTYYVSTYAINGNKLTSRGDQITFKTLENTASYISVTSPTNTINWPRGSIRQITWNDNIDDNVNIELYKGTTKITDIAQDEVNTGNYNWTIPLDLELGTDYKIKITSVEDNTLFGESLPFIISEELAINITFPTPGHKTRIGKTYTITWNDNIADNVNISLQKGATQTINIVQNTESDGEYSWTIPADEGITADTDYSITITSVSESTVKGSSSDFEILDAMTIISPRANVEWKIGNTYEITWEDEFDDNVNIELFKGGIKLISSGDIAVDVPSNGSFSWSVPTSLVDGSDYTIKITNINNSSLTNVSEQFTLYEAPTVTDYDNNTYETIKIGEQWWMAENLKVTHYADGSEIQLVEDGTAWENLGDNSANKAYCYMNNNASNEADTYGALYNWAAAMNGENSSNTNPSNVQGVCPTGWHLPSYDEWVELIEYLGGTSVAGGKLKAPGDLTTGNGLWTTPNVEATNESGFKALPGGFRSYSQGIFFGINAVSRFWASTEHPDFIYSTHIENNSGSVMYLQHQKTDGLSVRCVKN